MQEDNKVYTLVITKVEKHVGSSHLRGSYTIHLSYRKRDAEVEKLRFTKLIEVDSIGTLTIKYYAICMTYRKTIFSKLRQYSNARAILNQYLKRCRSRYLFL